MKATQQLRDEHEGVLLMLNILEQVCMQLNEDGRLNREHFEGILDFLKGFVDKCHHGKEEDLLFPALIAAGAPKDGPIVVMLRDHQTGRDFIKAMSEGYFSFKAGENVNAKSIIQNAKVYIALLRGHIDKENSILFAMADKLLSEEKQDELYEGFEKIEDERIGIGRHEEYHGLLGKLNEIYLEKAE